MTTEEINELKHAADYAAVGLTVGSVIEWLPPTAALVTIIWTLLRIYETETVRKWLKRK